MYKIAFLFDPSNDWISKYFLDFVFKRNDVDSKIFFNTEKIDRFDVVFILGYTKILEKDFLRRNALNLVVHESALPKGKGFAPVQWQVLEGKQDIPISLIEATEDVDNGDIFLQSFINLSGFELYDEIRNKQADATKKLVEAFVEKYPNLNRTKQKGEGSFYRKRTAADGELDIDKSIREQFNHLRTGNNENWPSFFYFEGKKFILKIYEHDNGDISFGNGSKK